MIKENEYKILENKWKHLSYNEDFSNYLRNSFYLFLENSSNIESFKWKELRKYFDLLFDKLHLIETLSGVLTTTSDTHTGLTYRVKGNTITDKMYVVKKSLFSDFLDSLQFSSGFEEIIIYCLIKEQDNIMIYGTILDE